MAEITLSKEIKQSIIDYVFENPLAIINHAHPPFNMMEFLILFDQALRTIGKGYRIDDLEEQAPEFIVFDNGLSIGYINGFGPHDEPYIFGITYSFNNFSEDIRVIDCVNSRGEDKVLTLKR